MTLIDKEALLEKLSTFHPDYTFNITSFRNFIKAQPEVEMVKDLPSAQPDTDSRIEKAIRVLQKNYNLALSRDYIRNPIAWALYETWKEFDR